MPVVWSDDHRLHDPGGEVWLGVRIPGDRAAGARRADPRARSTADGAWFVDAEPQPDDASTSVHDAELIDLPRARLGRLGGRPGSTEDPGQDRVVPYLFPHPGLFSGGRARRARPQSPPAPGQFAYDTMTAVGPGTWEAARARRSTPP